MPRPRKELISTASTPYYHCIVRCVRRAFLCGNDPITGKNFDHRKQWTVIRLKQLASVFAIDICAFAVMSNHYHCILHINEPKAKAFTDREVAERWCLLFKAPSPVQKWLNGEPLTEGDRAGIDGIIVKWRKRLADISWFMRCMNETIARKANKEDDCTGRFWSGRFQSQALLDDTALLACMTYVDLNPIRAQMADDLESSDFTSIQSRLYDHLAHFKNQQARTCRKRIQQRVDHQHNQTKDILEKLPQANLPQASLLPLDGSCHTPIHTAIPFAIHDYIALIDATGRVIREDKKGFISSDKPALLKRLGIETEKWITCVKAYGNMFSVVAGNKTSMQQHLMKTNKRWLKGASSSFATG